MLEERHILKEEGALESKAGAVDETALGAGAEYMGSGFGAVGTEQSAQTWEISWGRPFLPFLAVDS